VTANVLVRVARALELDVLAELNEELQRLHFENRPDQFNGVDSEELKRWLADTLQTPAATVWVAEMRGVLVGYAIVFRRERTATPFCPARVWWELDAIGVRTEHRRTGIGRGLVGRIVAEAESAGIADIELNSWAFNTSAQAAFQRLGFKPKSTRFELRLTIKSV